MLICYHLVDEFLCLGLKSCGNKQENKFKTKLHLNLNVSKSVPILREKIAPINLGF